MIIQPIVDIPEILYRLGIRHAVISPGSRNAPIIMSLVRHTGLTCFVVPDERSAAYIGLGIAQSTRQPVVITCTSGTAALNYAPAVAEAFYQQVPLLVLTADRPPEWIDQNDGQAIRQHNVYGHHVKYNNTLPLYDGHKDTLRHSHRITSEAVLAASRAPAGPVHINIPIREPFYPGQDEHFVQSKRLPVIEDQHVEQLLSSDQWQKLEKALVSKEKVLIVVGQCDQDPMLGPMLHEVSALWKIPVLADHTANLPGFNGTIRRHDEILTALPSKDLLPDLVISFGRSLLSKNLKSAFRALRDLEHWHIGHELPAPDPFGALSAVVPVHPFRFLQSMAASRNFRDRPGYFNQWTKLEAAAGRAVEQFFPTRPFGEFEAVKMVLDHIPDDAVLHLANSMPVRYAQALSTSIPEGVRVYSNRGTSGIDGCSSTMIGHALTDDGLHLLLTGDMAFQYDRNAFWHNHLPHNVRVVVLNNSGGGIFRLIPGPDRQPELDTYLETVQKQNAANTASDFGFKYYHCTSRKGLASKIGDFFSDSGRPKILEVSTHGKSNQKVWRAYKRHIKRQTS